MIIKKLRSTITIIIRSYNYGNFRKQRKHANVIFAEEKKNNKTTTTQQINAATELDMKKIAAEWSDAFDFKQVG